MGRKQKLHGTPKVSTSKADGVASDTARPAAPGDGEFDQRHNLSFAVIVLQFVLIYL